MANSISVAVGDSDTMRLAPARPRSGWSRPCRSRRPPGPRAAAGGQAVSSCILLLVGGCEACGNPRHQPALPPRTELAATEAGDLACPRHGWRGLTVAGQRRIGAGLRWSPWHPAEAPG